MIERDKNTSYLKEIPALPRVTPVDSAGNYFFEIATFVNNILAVLEENADKIPVEDLKVVERTRTIYSDGWVNVTYTNCSYWVLTIWRRRRRSNP